jgi:hypothetical protein
MVEGGRKRIPGRGADQPAPPPRHAAATASRADHALAERRQSLRRLPRHPLSTTDGIAGSQREYIEWLLRTCTAEETQPAELIDEAEIDLLAAKLRTPLQIEQHLALAFEEAFRVGEKPVTVEVVEAVLSRQLDDLEPKLMRHGYDVRILASQFNAKPVEIRQFPRGALDAARARELTDQMLAAGLPL